jgi:type IV pilus assembly protein PilQ
MNKPTFPSSGFSAALLALALGTATAAMPAAAKERVTSPRAATTTFDFRNIPVRSALQLIAEEGDFNLIVSDSVQGNITLRLVDVTWEQALEVVLRMKGLGQRVDPVGNSVTVTGE